MSQQCEGESGVAPCWQAICQQWAVSSDWICLIFVDAHLEFELLGTACSVPSLQIQCGWEAQVKRKDDRDLQDCACRDDAP